MSNLAPPSDRDELRDRVERAVDQWIATLREHADTIDRAQAEGFRDTARRLSVRLNHEITPSLDPEARSEISATIIEGIDRLYDGDEIAPLDILDDLMVRAEQIRHIIRDSLDMTLECDAGDTAALVARLKEWLPRINQQTRAKLIGHDVRTLERWGREGKLPPRRLVLVVELVALLRRSWTPEGIVAWFHRERRDLGGRRPIDVLDDPSYDVALREAVRHGRAQVGS